MFVAPLIRKGDEGKPYGISYQVMSRHRPLSQIAGLKEISSIASLFVSENIQLPTTPEIADALVPLIRPNGKPRDAIENPATFFAIKSTVAYPNMDMLSWSFKEYSYEMSEALDKISDPDDFQWFEQGHRVDILNTSGQSLSPRDVDLYVVAPYDNRTVLEVELSRAGIFTKQPSREKLHMHFNTRSNDTAPPLLQVFFAPGQNRPVSERNNPRPGFSDITAWVVLENTETRGTIICREEAMAIRLMRAINGPPRAVRPI